MMTEGTTSLSYGTAFDVTFLLAAFTHYPGRRCRDRPGNRRAELAPAPRVLPPHRRRRSRPAAPRRGAEGQPATHAALRRPTRRPAGRGDDPVRAGNPAVAARRAA